MQKRALGRGLGALIPGAEPSETGAVRQVPLRQIRANPYQPRRSFEEGALEELAQSIREHGVLQPLLLRETGIDSYELIAGERRLRAARRAGLDTVPALIREYTGPQQLEVALIENLQREDISPVDAAIAYRRLMEEFGLTQAQIAERVGKAQPTIANTLRLLALPPPVLESLQVGEITEGHARALLQAPDPARLEAWQSVVRRRLSVREAERLARELRAASTDPPPSAVPTPAAPAPADPNLAAVEEALQTALGTKVTIRSAGAGGRIEIEYYSLEELDGIVERVLGAGC